MADYEMDEACNACGAPVGEPCKADCSGICCDTGETQEVRGLRSEVARLRHALDECRAGMWEANERAEQWNALWHRDVAAAIEAESIASLAMSEGLRAVEQEAAEADALSDALDARTQRCDREMRELAEATGVAWRGHTHEDVVAMVRSKRERAEKVVEAAKKYDETRGGCDNPDVPLTCTQKPGEQLCPWCELSAAFAAAYEEG